ncbi:MAG TPA: DUF47 family protein, partial [Chlamydiales bacterium]|nr:DUF47 family protein [Chlamydiales bacterium]
KKIVHYVVCMFRWLLPKEFCFFTFFKDHAAVCEKAAMEFAAGSNYATIKELEHQADDITHKCKEALHKTFITPIDRDDIFKLISTMDDIIDNIDTAASRLSLYKIQEPTAEFRLLTHLLEQATKKVSLAVCALPHLKNSAPILQNCIEINSIENEADWVFNEALVNLFNNFSHDPCLVFKWKEIYEIVEEAVDRCEDVANIVEGIILEYA